MKIFTALLLTSILFLTACDNQSGTAPVVTVPVPDAIEVVDDGLFDISGVWYGQINPTAGVCDYFGAVSYELYVASGLDGLIKTVNLKGDLLKIVNGECTKHTYIDGLFDVMIPVAERQNADSVQLLALNGENTVTVVTFNEQLINFNNVYATDNVFNVTLSRLPL